MATAHPYHFHVYDVFTEQRFAGNPLAIVLGADGTSDRTMQAVAREFNLSETIFITAPDDPSHEAGVRIFTPTYEMPFAGHPVVGAAIHLAERRWHKGPIDETIVLECRAGAVPVRVRRGKGHVQATFTAPIIPHPVGDPVRRELAAQALGLSIEDVRDDHPCVAHEGGPTFAYVPLASLDALAKSRPTEPVFSETFERSGRVGVYCYAADPQADGLAFRARMFAPGAGVAEDPATGSASAILASQLFAANAIGDGTTSVSLIQGVEMGRRSEIALEVDVSNGAISAVRVTGAAVRVSDGQILA